MSSPTSTAATDPCIAEAATAARGAGLAAAYQTVRQMSEHLCKPLVTEDYVVQTMPDVSPTRWHLAHTTWFFETFVLAESLVGYEPYEEQFRYLFNSYYNTVGDQFPRPQRGHLSRPTVKEIYAYRRHVDQHMGELFASLDERLPQSLANVIETGLHHEQQHQELMVTDIKHVFSCNPLHPVYRHPLDRTQKTDDRESAPLNWVPFPERIQEIGFDGTGFCYDNERPRHRVLVPAFELADRLITNGEYQRFINDGGYERPELWLSAGWDVVQSNGWRAPLYWAQRDDRWWHYSLAGFRPVDDNEPVCHVSHFEADAYARWAGVLLPTEFAWETAVESLPCEGNFVESGELEPMAACGRGQEGGPAALRQMYGDVWEWTASPYVGYPGYRAPQGALGEYNSKFMCNQMVLRGGSCATSRTHIRPTYRNFFPPDARWQFTGIRLARLID